MGKSIDPGSHKISPKAVVVKQRFNLSSFGTSRHGHISRDIFASQIGTGTPQQTQTVIVPYDRNLSL